MNDMTVVAGQRLRRARGDQKLSMRQLAQKASLSSASMVSRAEHGFETSFTTIAAMAGALGVSLDALIAPTMCVICDGIPPPGFTCTSCRREGERSAEPDKFRTTDPEFWRHQPTEFA